MADLSIPETASCKDLRDLVAEMPLAHIGYLCDDCHLYAHACSILPACRWRELETFVMAVVDLYRHVCVVLLIADSALMLVLLPVLVLMLVLVPLLP